MKKVNTDALEKMAKEKNIDKEKIEKIATNYKGKSENELMDELVKIGKTLQGKEQVVSKLKTFLDEDQRKKIDTIMNKISEAEIQNKIDSKKSSQKKHSSSNPNSKSSKESNHNEKISHPTQTKKVKKVVKKVKKSNPNS